MWQYRIAGIIRGGIIFALFTVEFHPRKINPRNIAGGIGSARETHRGNRVREFKTCE